MRHKSYSRWKEPLPAWLTGMLRTFAWLGALGLIYLVGSVAASMTLANHYPACEAQMSHRNDGSALDRTRGFLGCLKDRAGLLDGMTLKSISHFVEPMPLTPQAYRGSWIATRPGSRWRIELHDDGSFVAEQLQGPPTMQGMPMTGVWSVVDEHFVWLYDEGQVWPPDINLIRDAYSGSFNLREKDRSLTHYERERL